MKTLYIVIHIGLLICITSTLGAQDIPLFSQKLTNSFMYNPAVAGASQGSLTYSYRQSYGALPNAPQNNFISAHTPLAEHKFGVGVNYYLEEVNFLKNNYVSAAFAYHIHLNRNSQFSMGVSGEYNFLRQNGNTNSDATDPVYMSLANGELNDYDFSFGVMYQNQYVKAGLAANRLATSWIKDETTAILTNYYTSFLQGTLPIRGGKDLLEPFVTYRKFSPSNSTLDLGAYYTFNKKILAGAAFRSGSIASLTAGFYLTPKTMIGYSREMFLGDVNNQVGATNELTLRIDFKVFDYQTNFKNDYKNSMAYRRKTLSTSNPGSKSPAQLHRKQKKVVPYSPNKRYQNIKKLSVPVSQRQKLSSSKKKMYKSKGKTSKKHKFKKG